MARLFLVHWNAGEAEALAGALRKAGHEVEFRSDVADPSWLKRLDSFRLQAFVISLDRIPSHGRAVAAAVGERKAARTLPIIFAGGAPEKVAETRAKFAEAIFVEWKHIRSGIQKALRGPVQPHPKRGIATHGPLVKRLGIQDGTRVVTFNAPASFERTVGRPVEEEGSGPADRVLLFCESEADLARDFERAARAAGAKGGLWIAWPKRASGVRTDLSMSVIREFAMARGWVDYKVCAIDATWSGSLLGRQRKERLLD